MSKNVVLCLDGTGNQFREHNSNVVKLFRVLTRDPTQQVGYYDPGVGTIADPGYKTTLGQSVNKALGLAFGKGLRRNVSQAYSYLMEHYEVGDRIFVFGFSRGAYTARALAGFIHRCGLLEKGCQNLIPYAMKLFYKADFETCARFRKTYGRDCRIHVLGLWDTVASYGFVYDPKHLPNTTNNSSVDIVRHAIAIDERRVYFRQNHWGKKPLSAQEKQEEGENAAGEQQSEAQPTQIPPVQIPPVKEVWFAGVHSDVGGGYPEAESGLAKIALKWMIQECRQPELGLIVENDQYERVVLGRGGDYVPPSATDRLHRSLKGLWWPVEFLPQRVFDSEECRMRLRLPRPSLPRLIPSGSTIHHTVLERMKAQETLKGTKAEKYEPVNLPGVEAIHDDYQIEEAPNGEATL